MHGRELEFRVTGFSHAERDESCRPGRATITPVEIYINRLPKFAYKAEKRASMFLSVSLLESNPLFHTFAHQFFSFFRHLVAQDVLRDKNIPCIPANYLAWDPTITSLWSGHNDWITLVQKPNNIVSEARRTSQVRTKGARIDGHSVHLIAPSTWLVNFIDGFKSASFIRIVKIEREPIACVDFTPLLGPPGATDRRPCPPISSA